MPKRYTPRKLLVCPQHFGVVKDAVWRTSDDVGMSDLAVAYFQHRIATVLRQRIDHGELKWDDAADLLGMQAPHLRRKLRGEVPMTMDDVMMIALRFGVDVVPPLERAADLLPSTRSTRA